MYYRIANALSCNSYLRVIARDSASVIFLGKTDDSYAAVLALTARMLNVSLSHLLEHGVRLESGEAVAIAQLLIDAPGVPAIDNVELRTDGSVACPLAHGLARPTHVHAPWRQW